MKVKSKTKQKKISWFVEPLDADTNEIIAKPLVARGDLVEHVDLLDDQGEQHSVFEVPAYSFITQLYKDKHKFKLDFRVFYRQSKYGSLKIWLFGEK